MVGWTCEWMDAVGIYAIRVRTRVGIGIEIERSSSAIHDTCHDACHVLYATCDLCVRGERTKEQSS